MKVALILLFTTTAWSAQNFIIGGSEVASDDPIAHNTVLVSGPSGTCSGVIYDRNLILTAAHCIHLDEIASQQVQILFVLSYAFPENGYSAQVLKGAYPPEWKGDQAQGIDQYDIGLLRFQGALPLGYKPAELFQGLPQKSDTAIIAGYGRTSAQDSLSAGTLEKAELVVADPYFGKTEVLLDQSKGQAACFGDSGGPAFTQDLLLWGLANGPWPEDDSTCAKSVVYVRLNAHVAWIAKTAKALSKN